MKDTKMNLLPRCLHAALGIAVAAGLAGCASLSSSPDSASLATLGSGIQGKVHGGQQPVSGATIQLYAAGTGGYGSAATPLLNPAVKTGADGSFNISGDYTCPAGAMIYMVGTGGNPGVSGAGNNSALAMMVGLGSCAELSGDTFINMNELTTVATVWALSPFMSSLTQVGTSSTNTQGLANAFAAIDKIVDIGQGTVSGPALPAGATLPIAQINTMADILSSCVNTVDNAATATQSGLCQSIFSVAATGSSTPKDTVQAAINLAHNPTLGLASLTDLVPVVAPFQPTLAAPPSSWNIAINYVGGGLNAPAGVAVDASGNVWLPNAGNNSVTKLANSGAPLSPSTGFTAASLSTPTAVAIDTAGNAWVANGGNSSVSLLNSAGVATGSFNGGGINIPTSVSIDGVGNVWVANYGSSTLTQLSSTGTVLSGANGYSGGGISHPMGLAINPQ